MTVEKLKADWMTSSFLLFWKLPELPKRQFNQTSYFTKWHQKPKVAKWYFPAGLLG